mmetsp:Transcript_1378/g.4243  ORF Transcript_1378/g.4243 Transcript_1378/m.4243 type:complete len:210 (-) Transcript_1378:396-1025(-)
MTFSRFVAQRRMHAAKATSRHLYVTAIQCCTRCSGTPALCSSASTSSSPGACASAKASTWSERVAEARTICRCLAPCTLRSRVLATRSKISRICFSKPMSRRRSTSSRMTKRRFVLLNASVVCRWSSSLPGVATSTEIPFRSRAFSDLRFSPPVMHPATSHGNGLRSLLRTSWICWQSSREGAITSARVPSARETFASPDRISWRTGTR